MKGPARLKINPCLAGVPESISARFLVPSTFRRVVAASRRVEWLKFTFRVFIAHTLYAAFLRIHAFILYKVGRSANKFRKLADLHNLLD